MHVTPMRRQLLSAYPQYTSFGVVDRDGAVWCSSAPIRTPVNLSDRPYIRHALDKGGEALSGYHVGRLTGLPSIAFASPIVQKDGSVGGAAFASLRASVFGALGPEVDMPQDAIYAIVDHDGRLLRRFPEGSSVPGTDRSETEPVRAARDSLFGSTQAAGSDGVVCLYGYAWTGLDRNLSVLVVVGVSKELAVAPANRAMWLGLSGLLVVAALTILFASFASRAFIGLVLGAGRAFSVHGIV